VKIVNNQNQLMVNKYQVQSNSYQYDKEQTANASASAKNSKINNILSDFEKNKALNQELMMKNMQSPKIYGRGNDDSMNDSKH